MSNYKELLKHSGNYLFATLATKALSFISIPVYTYLLTVEDYGVYNVFSSTLSVATVLLSLNTEVAIGRYFYDSENEKDFKRFVGTSINLISIVFLIMSFFMIVFVRPLSDFLGFEWLLIISMIPMALYTILNSIFQQIYQPMLQSRKIAVVSSIQSYLAFGLSVLFMLFLNEKKYYGLVLGTIMAMLILATYSINQIKPYCIRSFDAKYISYIFKYSIPYLPYSLSGIIIAQFGKIFIGQQQGFETAGLYSFAANISSIMLILIFVVHSAWNPFYFRYMNEKDYESLNNDYNLIWRGTLTAGLFLSFFGKELGMLLGRPEFASGLSLIPVFVLGYVFYQWSYVYMRNVGYSKQTIWNAVAVIITGVSNIILNFVLSPLFYDYGVALAFMFSYLILLIVSWFINKIFLKQYASSVKLFLSPFILFLMLIIGGVFINESIDSDFVAFFMKLMVSVTANVLIMKKYLKMFCVFIKR